MKMVELEVEIASCALSEVIDVAAARRRHRERIGRLAAAPELDGFRRRLGLRVWRLVVGERQGRREFGLRHRHPHRHVEAKAQSSN